jgi:hypothetical protein
MIDASAPPPPRTADSAVGAASARDIRTAVTRLIDTQLDLVRTVVDTGIAVLLKVSSGSTSGSDPGVVQVEIERGSSATANLWLHNQTAAALSGPIAASPLFSGLRHALPPSGVRFGPDTLERLAPASSASIEVTISAAGDQPEGRYYGFVFVLGHADAVAQLIVDVHA